jgi:hypothetical protein
MKVHFINGRAYRLRRTSQFNSVKKTDAQEEGARKVPRCIGAKKRKLYNAS